MPRGLRDHPLRRALIGEIHARPFDSLRAPLRATHLALLSGERAGPEEHASVSRLCERFGAAPPDPGTTYFVAELGPVRLKWERHTEFSTYTVFQEGASRDGETDAEAFAVPALRALPDDWLAALPGELLTGVHLEFEERAAPPREPEALARLFETDNLAGSLVAGGAATVWMDFAAQPDGYSRILVHDRQLRPRQAGRLVQRLFEIETYRMLALLALPVARRDGAILTRAGERLTAITTRMTEIGGLADEQRLLDELTGLSAEIEVMAAADAYRFGAARAYYALVLRRVEELREVRVEGMQTIAEFLERRLAPAMLTCETVALRIETFSERVGRASQLLRARVDLAMEAQNSDLLRSMNRRARLQLRLQQTVEGLSVAAISYYLVGLIGYAAKAGAAAGLRLNEDLVTGLSIPFVVALVGLGVLRLRRQVERDTDPRD